MRHKSAAIVFVGGAGLYGAQVILGHNSPIETVRYIKSSGLYEPQTRILEALENCGIGQAVGSLLDEMEMPRDELHEAFCNPAHVTQ
jgi:hypothetical protein